MNVNTLVGADEAEAVEDPGSEAAGGGITGHGAPTGSEPRWTRWVAAAIVVVVVAPILVSGFEGLRRAWYPAGDWAMTELRVMDVGSRHTPLAGPYSRFSWNHPGPMLFWLLAVPYRLSAGSSSALLWAASLINAGSVAGMLGLAWRRGRLPLVCCLAVALALCTNTLGPLMLRNPWNAWVTVLPFGLFVLAAWSAIEGDRVGLLTLAVVGSFLSQSHVGFVPFVVVLTAAGVFGFVRRVPGWRMPLIAGGLLVLCWLPVLIGTLTGDGNALKVVQYFAGGGSGDAAAGLGGAFGVTALELGGWGPWLGSLEIVNANGGSLEPRPASALVVPVLAFVVAALVAWRRRADSPPSVSLLVVIALTAATAVVAVSRVNGGVFDYLVRWWWPLAALWWTAVVWVLGQGVAAVLRDRVPRRAPPWLVPAGTVALAVACIVVAGRFGLETAGEAGAAPLPVDDWGPSMAALAPSVHDVPHERDGSSVPVLLRNVGPLGGWASDAYSVQLARDGVDVRVDDSGINAYKFGPHRLWDGRRDVPVIWLVTGSWIDDFERAGKGRVLDHFDPLSPSERTAYREAEHRLRVALRAAGRDDIEHALDEGTSLLDAAAVEGVDGEDLATVEAGRRRGVPIALYLFSDTKADLPEHQP